MDASVVIAGDLDAPSPDVRDAVSESRRSSVSASFAEVRHQPPSLPPFNMRENRTHVRICLPIWYDLIRKRMKHPQYPMK